jgi:hypothetical protein
MPNAMKPIIFSTPMVKAILDGRKTQTRRVIKIDDAPENWRKSLAGTSVVRASPYDVRLSRYKPSDILWVRETWQYLAPWSEDESHVEWEKGKYYYAADGTPNITITDGDGFRQGNFAWRPSIFMPREATRIFLRVTEVRVERLQDISYDDCLQEGMHDYGTDVDTLGAFQDLWQKLNAKRGYGWDTNPWVWVISFERIESPGE